MNVTKSSVMTDEAILRKYDFMLNFLVFKFSDKSIANRQYFCADVLKEDAKQEAAIALLNAASSFDESRGIKFETYATVCIEHTLSKVLKDSKKIYVCSIEDMVSDEKNEDSYDSVVAYNDNYDFETYVDAINKEKDFLASVVPLGYEIYERHILHEETMAEISRVMNLSPTACYYHLRKFITCVKRFVI